MARTGKKKTKPQVIERVLVVDSNGKQLSPKQAIFARVFSDPESPHFMNASKAMQIASPNLSPETARSMAQEYLAKPHVANRIVEVLNRANLGVEVRAEKLADIISHRAIGKVVSRTHNEDGSAVTETTHSPSWGQVLRAIDVTNRLDGSYQAATRTVDLAADEYRRLLARHFPPRGQGAATGQGGKRPRARGKNDPSVDADPKNPGGTEERTSPETPLESPSVIPETENSQGGSE